MSSDVKAYEAIVKGKDIPNPGVPESFKVLIKEFQSLCLDVKVLDEDGNEINLETEDDMDTGYDSQEFLVGEGDLESGFQQEDGDNTAENEQPEVEE